MSRTAPVTVVETPGFLESAAQIMGEDERSLLVDYLAHNPSAGDIIPGTGGVRKLRWSLQGRGKRSGARVIYYYHNVAMPLFALDAFAKNDRVDLSQAERNELHQLTDILITRYARKKL